MVASNPITPREAAGFHLAQARAVLDLVIADNNQCGEATRDGALFGIEALLDAAQRALDQTEEPATAPATPALTPNTRRRALALARELQEHSERHMALVGAIEERLKPPAPGEDSAEYSAWKLAQTLYESMGDAELLNELIALLDMEGATE